MIESLFYTLNSAEGKRNREGNSCGVAAGSGRHNARPRATPSPGGMIPPRQAPSAAKTFDKSRLKV